jgi:Flp pilus assembly protein TadD
MARLPTSTLSTSTRSTSTPSDARYRLDLRVLRFRSDPRKDEPALLAQDLLGRGRYAEALELTSAALEEDPEDTDLLVAHGVALAKAGDLATAQLALTRAAKTDPGWSEPWRHLAQVLWQRGKSARALQVARRGLEVEPGDDALKRIAASANLELRARAWLLAPTEEDPTMLAQALLADERADLAFEVTRTALLDELLDEDLLMIHARAARALGDLDEAVQALRTATLEAPDWPDAYALLAEVHELRGEPDQARQVAFQGLAACPGDASLRALHERLETEGETLVTL